VAVKRLREIAHGALCAWRVIDQRPGIVERVTDRPVPIHKALDVEANAVPREQRFQLGAPREQTLPRLVVCGIAQAATMRIAEDVREEHVGILAFRLEQQNIGLRILLAVFLHADFHPRVNDGAECLGQD